jgi:hypothetical protein
MYNRGRKHKRNYNGYYTTAAFIQPQYLEKERTPSSWLQSWTVGAAITIAALFFFNLVKLPSPLDVILPWLVCLFGGGISISWLWQWNADRAFARNTGTSSTTGKHKPERLDEDSYAPPVTPEELEGITIQVNHYGKPVELVAPVQPIKLRGYNIQRTPGMDDLSTWELLTQNQPGFARSTVKYIGTIGEDDSNV